MDFPKIEFGALRYRLHEGEGVYTASYEKVDLAKFEDGIREITLSGFSLVSEDTVGPARTYTFRHGLSAIFLTYFKDSEILFFVTEPNCRYLDYSDTEGERVTTASVTQLDLSDFGMSYIIRLPDGRLIIIDGGRIDDIDSDNLLRRMTERCGGGDIVIGAWIMTHPHLDHYRCFISFMEKYSELVTVEKLIYNFPDADEGEYEAYPTLMADDEVAFLKRFYALVEKTGAPVFRAHTGQVYNVGSARIEMLGTPDDNENVPVKNFNFVSLVMRMTLEGQILLFCGDKQFQHSALVSLWGDYLKCDIMQIPHHGFHGGTMRLFDLADARVYFSPSFITDCFEKILVNYDFNLHMWFDLDPDDFITGSEGDVTIDIPYTPSPDRKLKLKNNLEKYKVKREPKVITEGL